MKNQIQVCKKCGYNHVEKLAWVDINTKKFMDNDDDGDTWCPICIEKNLYLVNNTDKGEVIGFQVESNNNEHEIHPNMDSSFCVYSFEQVQNMIDDDDKWKIVCVYDGDIEEPTMMFKGKSNNLL